MGKIVRNFIILFIIGFGIYIAYDIYKEKNIKDYSIAPVKLPENIENETIEKNEEKLTDLELVPKTYKGYKVSAKLKIEKLNIDSYVLSEYKKDGMEVCICKYFGPNANEAGNYCIAGHNYITKNMFSKLGNLKIGDSLSLTDNFHGEILYEVYDKFKVKPNETSVLSQNTNGQKEITLITCSDYSSKRIIVKAKEKEA